MLFDPSIKPKLNQNRKKCVKISRKYAIEYAEDNVLFSLDVKFAWGNNNIVYLI